MKEFIIARFGDVRKYVLNKLSDYSLVILVAFIVYQCSPYADITRGDNEFLGEGHWTVDGISIGDTFEHIVTIKNKRRFYDTTPEMPGSYLFGSNRVGFDKEGHVISVGGIELHRDDRLILQYGTFTSKMQEILGEGYIVKQYRSTGSDMAAWMTEYTHTEHQYSDRKRTKFIINTDKKDTIIGIFAKPIEDN